MSSKEVGARVGLAIARDVIRYGDDREWTGLSDLDGDQLTKEGICPDTTAWEEAEEAAEIAYHDYLAGPWKVYVGRRLVSGPHDGIAAADEAAPLGATLRRAVNP